MKIIYLLLFPVSKKPIALGKQVAENITRAPYFLDIDIDIKETGRDIYSLDGEQIKQQGYIYDKEIYLFECSYLIDKELGEGLSKQKEHINSLIRERLVKMFVPDRKLVEEYTVLLAEKDTDVKIFVPKHKFALARFMRSVEQEISSTEAEEILTTRVSYSNDDLAIIDWEGAVLFDKSADFETQMELIKIGNYQLMRYRALDHIIEANLKDIRRAVEGKKKNIIGSSFIKTAIENKLSILLDFDRVDQSLLLVGDWYSAKFYKAIISEFYLEDWKNLVKDKIENLESIDAAVRDNLVYSWRRILDLIQIIGWLVLLVGYFVLYLKDASVF